MKRWLKRSLAAMLIVCMTVGIMGQIQPARTVQAADVKIFTLADAGIAGDGVLSIWADENQIYFETQAQTLTAPLRADLLPKRKTVVLGFCAEQINEYALGDSVASFNRTSQEYTIEVKSYDTVSDLNLAILSGDIDLLASRDVLALNNYAQKGLLLPLEKIAPDLFGDGVLMENVVDALRYGEQCYYLTPCFSVTVALFENNKLQELPEIRSFEEFTAALDTLGDAFYHCDTLKEISIPQTVTWIEPSAFAYTAWMDAWASNTSADDFLIVGDNILIAYKGTNKYVEIPNGVETIAPACFYGHNEILGVNIPGTVTIIGEETFKDCTSLAEVHGAENVVKIQDRAFENTNLSEITLHKYVEEIGVGAFSGRSDKERKAYFKGSKLPSLSFTQTTSNLSNDLLQPAFDGNWTAIVNATSIDLENTIFENGYLGFVGDIATLDGNGNSKVFATKKAASLGNNSISVNTDMSQWSASQISTNLNYSGEYHLTLKEQPVSVIEDAFKRIYGNQIPVMSVFEMTLTDVTDTINITAFGNNPLSVTVPLPTEIKGNTIHVVALDEDGQLEKLSSSLEQKNGKNYIQFSTNHLSTFAIFAMGENGSLQIENGEVLTTVSGRKDYSPNTGDGSIHPKWFMALGLTAIAIGLIYYKPKKKRIY